MKKIFFFSLIFSAFVLCSQDMEAQKAQSFQLEGADATALLDTIQNADTVIYNIPLVFTQLGVLEVVQQTVDTITNANAGTFAIQYQVEPNGPWLAGLSGNMAANPTGANGVGGTASLVAVNVNAYACRAYVLSTGTHTTSIKLFARWTPGEISGLVPFGS